MLKIAIILFPGLNTEYETRREIKRAGMRGEFFRWNENPSKLKQYDGYIIGGGFSYEDRGRAGIVASLDPIMKIVASEAEKGKPVLGICNGAQILIESGLIPGVDGGKLAMALARNKRIRDGEILGTGYYNAWVHLKCVTKPQNCMFTWNMSEGEIIKAPIAHGEGRFTTEISDLIPKLQEKGQMVFRYCDKNGAMTENFPINPNGSMFNLAAVCNPSGNVMAVMPHLERDFASSAKLFSSMKDAISAQSKSKKRTPHLAVKIPNLWPISKFQPSEKNLEFFVSLIITDNEAETFEIALRDLGFEIAKVQRKTHFEIEYAGKPDLQKLSRKLIQSGILLNTNKEIAAVKFPKETLFFNARKQKFVEHAEPPELPATIKILIRESHDFVGLAKLQAIRKRLKIEEVTGIKLGTVWSITVPTKSKKVAEDELKKIIQTHLLFNPHRQQAQIL